MCWEIPYLPEKNPLKLGRVPAEGIMRTLQVADKPTRLAKAIAEIGRIDKTIHMLNYLHDESFRRQTLVQLNLGEGRHSLGRVSSGIKARINGADYPKYSSPILGR